MTKLQHADLKGNNVYFMVYDAAPEAPLNNGNQMYMGVDVTSENKGQELFDKLPSQGKVHHNYREREGGYCGRCTDKFGINWMVNYNS